MLEEEGDRRDETTVAVAALADRALRDDSSSLSYLSQSIAELSVHGSVPDVDPHLRATDFPCSSEERECVSELVLRRPLLKEAGLSLQAFDDEEDEDDEERIKGVFCFLRGTCDPDLDISLNRL